MSGKGKGSMFFLMQVIFSDRQAKNSSAKSDELFCQRRTKFFTDDFFYLQNFMSIFFLSIRYRFL